MTFKVAYRWLAPALSLTLAANAQNAEPPVGSGISLVRAEEILRQQNHDLRSARLVLEGSEADVITARESPNPQLSVNSTMIDFTDGTGPGPIWNKRTDSVIRIDQQFERGGKRRHRERAALAAQAAASDSLVDVMRLARLALAQDYYELKAARESLAIAADVLRLQEQSLGSARYRLKAGGVGQVDVTRLEVEVARARASVIDAEGTHRQDQIALAHDLGLTVDATQLEASDAWPQLAHSAPQADAAVIEQRPDVRSAADLEEQARAQADAARALRTRDITVGVQYEREPQPLLSPNSVGVGFSIPLFVGNHYEGEIRRAEVDARSAHENLLRAKQDAGSDIAAALSSLDSSTQRLQAYESGVFEQAKSAAQATEYAYTRGALSLTDVLDARRDFQAVMLETLSARAAYAKALAQWRAATQRSNP